MALRWSELAALATLLLAATACVDIVIEPTKVPKKYEYFDQVPTPDPDAPLYVVFEDPSTLCQEEAGTLKVTDERIIDLLHKYEGLFSRQPSYTGRSGGTLMDENGEVTDILGISVHVEERIDQSTLPPEDRIPSCLEGIPVQIVVGPGRIVPTPYLPSKREE